MKISSFSKTEVKTDGSREARKFTATVRVGETKVAEVARRVGVCLEALVQANPQIKDFNALKAGQDIRLPADRPQTAPLAPRPPQKGAAPSTTASMDSLAKSMAQARLKKSESQTLELEPLPIVVERRHTEFSDAYDHLFAGDAGKTDSSGKTGETEETASEQGASSERENEVAERLETLKAAVNGDAAALEKIRLLPDVGLLELERMLEMLGFDWATLQTLFPDRVDRAAELTRDSLSGDENAWLELQKEWTGHAPTVQQRKDHANDPFGNWFRAERSFQLWGIPTRPQEHIDRGSVLQDALVRAQKGDLSGLAKLGIDKTGIPGHADGLIALLSPDRATASPEVMIPGVGLVGKKPDAGSDSAVTPLINEAENIIQKALTLDPAKLKDIGLDPRFLRDLLNLFDGWSARGDGGKTPGNNSDGNPSSATPNPANPPTGGGGSGSAHPSLGFTDTQREGSGALVGRDHDTLGGGAAVSGGAAASEGSGAARGGAVSSEGDGAASSGAAASDGTAAASGGAAFGTKEPANALPGTAWSPDGVKILVKDWNGQTREFKNIEEYRAWRDQESAKPESSNTTQAPTTTESDSTTESGSTSTDTTEETTGSDSTSEGGSASTGTTEETTDSDSATSGYRDPDASGYNNTTGSYEKLRLSSDPVPTNDGNGSSDVIEAPRVDAGTTPNVDPDYLESSATMTRATAPIDFHRDGAIQGPPPDRDDPSTQERR